MGKIDKNKNQNIIEQYVNEANPVELKITDLKESCLVTGCKKSTIKVDGKFNTLTIENCQDCGILVEHLVSTLEIVNCKKLQVQVTVKAPSIVIEKCDGLTLYLSKEGMDGDIVTSLSANVNVVVPKGDDMKEFFVPQQLVSKLAAAFAAGGWAGARTYFAKTPRSAKLGWALGMGVLGYWTATGIQKYMMKRQGCPNCCGGCATDKKIEVVTK